MAKALHKIWYDPATGFGGVDETWRRAKAKGVRVSRADVKAFIQSQEIEQHHRQYRAPKAFAKIKATHVGDLHQYDLMDMGGVWKQTRSRKTAIRWLLTGIDVFSRYAWAVPLEKKDAEEVRNGIVQLWSKLGEPERIEIDEGREFYGETDKLFKSKGIPVRRGDVGIHRQQSIIERFHLTLERKMIKFMRTKGGGRWLEALEPLLNNYNTSYHRTLRGKPKDVFDGKKDPATEPPRRVKGTIQAPLDVGTWVRYLYDAPEGALHRRAFDQAWSDEIAIIEARIGDMASPQLYYLTTEEGETIKRPYYRSEMQVYKKISKKVRAKDLS